MDARPLPRHPNLEQYKKQAKDLLKVCTSADPAAVRDWAKRWTESWADDWAETQVQLRGVPVTPELRAQIVREADRILKYLADHKIARLADAQFFLARAHGFESWPKFARQVQALEHGKSREAKFEAAADAIVSGDIMTVQQLLREDPQLIRARSQRRHHSTLLHYVSANGVEDFRQKTPPNIVAITKLLLDAGADVNAESDAYGGGSTALGLVATSVHPERAGVQEALLQLLLGHGAILDKPGVAGNRHSAVVGCLHNGQPRAAEFLAAHGARLDLEGAAGVGRLEIVESFFNADGSLKPATTREEMQRGFVWACGYGRHEVVEFLLAHGADLRDPAGTGEPPLHMAVVGGQVGTIKLLLERGAPLEELNAYGGTALGQAGWSFLHGNPEVDYVPIFETLLAAGARIEDGWLAWLEQQKGRPAAAKARLAAVLRRYGATT